MPAAASEILPLGEVRTGMKGYGLTVVRGSAVERFDVEIVGVLRNVGVGRSIILAELSGLGLPETGVVAGMSGSPVYLDGKLAGAVASGWGFSRKALAGITPIEAMLPIVPKGAQAAPGAPARGSGPSVAERAAAFARLAATSEDGRLEALRSSFLEALPSPSAFPAKGTTLLSFQAAGLPPSTLDAFRVPLSRLGVSEANLALLGTATPVPAGEPSAPATLAPGASLTAYLVRGDMQLGATGTVTEVFPDGRFVAFGHPFLGAGELELPAAQGDVVTVVSSLFQSFKLANGGEPRFRLTHDRDTGVGGRTDRAGKGVPVTVSVEAAGRPLREFRFEVASYPKLLPTLAALVADAALTTADSTPRERLLSFRVALDTAAGEIAYEDVATGMRAKEAAILTTAALATAVADNDLADPGIRGVRIGFSSSADERRLRLVDAAPASRKVAPGETLAVAVRLADRRGRESVRVVRLEVPASTPEGRATLVVSDGSAATALRQQLDPSEPASLRDLAEYVARIVPGNRLQAGLLVATRGAATKTATLDALPPTALALLSGGREQGEAGIGDVEVRLVSEQIVSFDRPVSGAVRIDVDVERARPRGTR